MSLKAGVPVSEVVTQGTGLIFIAYPTVFNILGTIGLILGPLFFFTVFVSGITSMLSSFEVFSSSVQNKFNLTRKRGGYNFMHSRMRTVNDLCNRTGGSLGYSHR